MQIHSVQGANIERQIERLKAQQVKQQAKPAFQDPIREFSRSSQVEGMVRNWLTYPVAERKRLVKDGFRFIPKFQGDERTGQAPETDAVYEARQNERWRGLCVVIQEESRAKAGNRSPEVAIGALKQLFPEYEWKPSEPPKGSVT